MNSGLFPKRINITPVIVTYQIIKIVDDWGGGRGGQEEISMRRAYIYATGTIIFYW